MVEQHVTYLVYFR